MTVIYIDLLFLINFSIDYISLYITGNLLHYRMTKGKLIGTSLGLAIYSIWALLYCQSYVLLIGTAIGCSCLAVLITYDIKTVKTLSVSLICFLGFCGLLAGISTLVLQFLSNIFKGNGTNIPADYKIVVFTVIIAISGISILIGNRLLQISPVNKIVTGTFTLDKVTASLRLLVDSGNVAVDPFSGKKVMVVSEQVMLKAFGPAWKLEEFLPTKKRVICLTTVTGKSVLPSFIIDKLMIEDRKYECILAVDSTNSYHNYDGIIPSDFMR